MISDHSLPASIHYTNLPSLTYNLDGDRLLCVNKNKIKFRTISDSVICLLIMPTNDTRPTEIKSNLLSIIEVTKQEDI